MTATEKRRKKRAIPLLCLAITIAILIAGLWPLNFRTKNEVKWLYRQNGIHFGRQGIAYSIGSIYGPQEAIRPGGSVSIELVIRPAEELNSPDAQILTLYGGGNRQYFTLAQWKSYLILRASSQRNDLRRNSREMGAKNILLKNISTRI